MVSKKISKAFAKISTAIVLVMMIVISCISAVAVNSDVVSSGSNEYNGQYLYVDTKNASKTFKGIDVFWQANYTDKKGYISKDSASVVETGVYKFDLSALDSSYSYFRSFNVCYTDNTTYGMVVENNNTKDCIKISGSSCSWTNYDPSSSEDSGSGTTGSSGNDEYNYYVPADSSMTDNNDLFVVNATYYDYWSDNERSQGKYQENESVDSELEKRWYMFDDFNKYISDYAKNHTSWKFPLYFGNLFKGDEHYTMFVNHTQGYGLRHMTGIGGTDWSGNEYYAINNSNGMCWYNSNDSSSYNQPLQGLVGNTLDSEGNLLATDNQTKIPYFDGKTLANATYDTGRTGKKVATVLKSAFPFRTEKMSGGKVTKYSFTSKNAKDNVYFSWSNRVPQTIKYGAGDGYGVHDALSKFGGSSDGYGLFPFNNNSAHWNNRPTNNNLDYGFGVRLDIDFRVPEKGLLPDGSNVKFNFSGDDDLWVFIGDKANGANSELVLDLAGDHKEAKGEINFNTMKATAKNVFADYSSGSAEVKNHDRDKTFNDGKHLSAGKTYHMTVFYMERGESESNFSVDFTMTPVNNTLSVDKTVNVDNVSDTLKNPAGSDLKEICKTIDQFGYEIKSTLEGTASSKEYKYNDNSGASFDAKTNSSGKFPLGDGDNAFFNGTFDASTSSTSNTITVQEGQPVTNKYTAGQNIVYLNTGSDNWFIKDKAVPYIKLSGESEYHAMNKLSDTIYYYPLGNNTGDFKIGRYVSGDVYNSHEFSWPLKSGSTREQIDVPDSDWANTTVEYSHYEGSVPGQGTLGTTTEQKLKYDTEWKLYDVDVQSATTSKGKLMDDGTGLKSQFEFINSLSNEEKFRNKTDLLLSYTNTVKAAPLTVKKKLYDADGSTETTDNTLKNTNFSFDLYLDTNYDGVFGDYEKFGSYTNLSVNNPVTISGIPVGMAYKVVEGNLNGYSKIVGELQGTISENTATNPNVATLENKINPGSVSLSVSKTIDDKTYSGKDFTFIESALSLDPTTGKYTEGTVIEQQDNVSANGTVSFDELTLQSSGTYYYAISENYGNIRNYDYQINDTVVIARVEFDPSIQDVAPEYAVYDDETVKSGYLTATGAYNFNKLVTDFDQHTVNGIPTIANKSSKLKLNVTKSEGLEDTNNDNVAELVNPIPDAEFELYAVADETVTDFTGYAPVGYGVSNDNGQVVFYTTPDKTQGTELTDLPIFKANSNPVDKDYQVYAVKETKAAEGYALTDEIKYVTLDKDAETGTVIPSYKDDSEEYVASFGFTNNLITIPFTGIQVDQTYFTIGCIVLGIGTLLGAYYLFNVKRRKVSYVSRHGR